MRCFINYIFSLLLLKGLVIRTVCEDPETKGRVRECQVPLEQRVVLEIQQFYTNVKGARWVEHEDQRMYLLSQLKRLVIDRNIPGSILELGCKRGDETSVNIRRFIDRFAPNRSYHVYDSFEGLPERTEADGINGRAEDNKGGMAVGEDTFRRVFKGDNLTLPDGIHKGFFGNISDDAYPSPVAFAFFDGDLYTSISDSFKKVYHKLAPGGVVIVHDYMADGRFRGPKKAIEDFLADKPEKVEECYSIMALIIKKGQYV